MTHGTIKKRYHNTDKDTRIKERIRLSEVIAKLRSQNYDKSMGGSTGGGGD